MYNGCVGFVKRLYWPLWKSVDNEIDPVKINQHILYYRNPIRIEFLSEREKINMASLMQNN